MTQLSDLHALIQADIDGVATTRERAKLRELLANDAEARAEHQRLSELRAFLGTIPPEQPPARLVAQVMRRIRTEPAAALEGGFLRRIFGSWPGGRVALPYAYAAVAGAAVGILGYHLVVVGASFGLDAVERDAAATIGSAPSGIETGRLELTAGTFKGSATLRQLDDTLAIDLDLPAQGMLDVSLAYDPAAVKIIGISNKTDGDNRIAMADGIVRWSQDGPQKLTVFLASRTPAGSRIEVRFAGQGVVGGEGSLELPGRH
jgi:hypothetical protein